MFTCKNYYNFFLKKIMSSTKHILLPMIVQKYDLKLEKDSNFVYYRNLYLFQ